MDKEYKWIKIEESGTSKSGKTKIYLVSNKIYGSSLGRISWNAGWRKYGFFPREETFYEEDCLRDIAQFLDELKVKND